MFKFITKKDIDDLGKEGRRIFRLAMFIIISTNLVFWGGLIWTIINIVRWSLNEAKEFWGFLSTLIPVGIGIAYIGLAVLYYIYEQNRIINKVKDKSVDKMVHIAKSSLKIDK